MIALEIVHYFLLIYRRISLFLLITRNIRAFYQLKKTYKNKQNKFVVFIPAYKER
jgi:hypothetical protein